jgi:hypothetical protein
VWSGVRTGGRASDRRYKSVAPQIAVTNLSRLKSPLQISNEPTLLCDDNGGPAIKSKRKTKRLDLFINSVVSSFKISLILALLHFITKPLNWYR